jgi:hypothetical protein
VGTFLANAWCKAAQTSYRRSSCKRQLVTLYKIALFMCCLCYRERTRITNGTLQNSEDSSTWESKRNPRLRGIKWIQAHVKKRQWNNRGMKDLYNFILINPFICMSLHVLARWSSGQSFWLQIQRPLVRFPALPDFLRCRASGTGPLSLMRTIEELLEWKISGSGLENRD